MRVPRIPVDEPPLRVLAITGNAIVGGMESTVLRLASRWPRTALRLTALCPFESPFTAALRTLDVDVHVAPIGEKLRWHTLQFAVELIREHGIAIVHTHMPAAHAIGGLAGRITHTSVLATIHAMHVSMWDLEVHRLADTHICVVSEAARAQALAIGVAAAHLSLIRNGVDCDRFVPRAERRCIDSEGATIGYVGRLSSEKHPALVLRAAALIRASVPDARFAIIGDGPLRSDLEALASRLRIRDAVSFEGECDNMPERYHSLDLLMVPSWHEDTPLALLEAMACGLPVVATDVGGIPEIVVSGKTGWLVTPGDEAEMAERAIALLHAPETMRRYGRAARERARTQFSLDEQAERTAALLRRLAHEAPKSKQSNSVRPMLASDRAAAAPART